MPIVILTEEERQELLEVLEMHCEGLSRARDVITTTEGTMEEMLEMTGTVDESVTLVTHIMKKVKDAY